MKPALPRVHKLASYTTLLASGGTVFPGTFPGSILLSTINVDTLINL